MTAFARRAARPEPMRVPRSLDEDPGLVLADSTWGEIQPIELAPGVRVVGEREVIAHIESGGRCYDSRRREAFAAGTIPGVSSLPHDGIAERRAELDASRSAVFFCNGPQCGATPTAVRALLAAGHPAELILYYRGGLHDWVTLGLPVAVPSKPLLG